MTPDVPTVILGAAAAVILAAAAAVVLLWLVGWVVRRYAALDRMSRWPE